MLDGIEVAWMPTSTAMDYEQRLTGEDGWIRYATRYDSTIFGIWVNHRERQIVTFNRGHEVVQTCPTHAAFAQELSILADLYGDY